MSNKVVERVRDRLSYGAFDWAVTEEEALGALSDLARMPDSQRRSVLRSLHKDGLVERLFDNLPEVAFKSRSKQVIAVYRVAPVSVLNTRMEELLDTGIFNSVTESEARQVLAMLKVLPQRTRDIFTYKDNGKWFKKLTDALPPPPSQSKAEAGKKGKDKKGKEDEDKPGFFKKAGSGMTAGFDLVRGAKIDLTDVETVMGGDMGGVQLADGGKGTNELDLNLDWEQGFLDAEIAQLNIEAMQVGAGENGTVSTGPGTLKGVHAQIKWSTAKDPHSELSFTLDELKLHDIQVLMQDLTVVIGLVALSGLEVYAKKPPERTSPPTSKLGAVRLVAKQVEEMLGTSLPGLASIGLVDPKDPSTLITRLKENFGGDLEFNVSLDSARIKDVSTSDGDSMEELNLDNLDVSIRQESRIQELELEHKELELTLAEANGDLSALSSEDHQRMSFIKAEIERLKPLEKEQKRLAARFRAGSLTARQRDRLRELDNELSQGVAKIELDRMAATGIVAKGHQMSRGEIEGLSARVSGGALNVHRETDRERLAKELGLPSPVKTAQTETENTRAHIQVKKVSTQGVTSDDMSLGAAEVHGIDGRIRNIEDPDSLKAQLAVDSASVTELQSAHGSVAQADVKGIKAGLDQKTKTAQATIGSAGASHLDVGGTSADEVALSDLGLQVTNYDDAEKRTAKGNLGSASVKGVRSEQGTLDSASIKDVRGAVGPGMKEAQADVGSASVQGLKSDKGNLESASLKGLHVEGTDLADADKRSAAASLDRADLAGLDAGGVKLAKGSLQGVSAKADPGMKSGSAAIDQADIAGLEGKDYGLKEGQLKGLSAQGNLTDKSGSASLQSADVEGLRVKSTTVGSGSLKDIDAKVGAGGDSASASIGSADVKKVKRGDLSIDEAKVRGLKAGGDNLNDRDNRTLSAEMESASVFGVKKGDMSLDSAGLAGVKASSSRGEKDANVSMRGAVVKGLDTDKADVGQANLRGFSASATDLDNADKRKVDLGARKLTGSNIEFDDGDAKAGAKSLDAEGLGVSLGKDRTDINAKSVGGEGVHWRQGDEHSAQARSLAIKDLGVGVGKDDVDVNAASLEGKGVGWKQGDKQSASAESLAFNDIGVGVGDDGVDVDVGKARATDIAYKTGDTEVKAGELGLDKTHFGMQGDKTTVGVGGVHAGNLSAKTKDGSARMDSLDIADAGMTSEKGNIKAGVGSLDARGVSGKQGDKTASVAALRVKDTHADIDTEAGKINTAGVGSVDVSGASYQDGDKTKASVNHLGVRDVTANDLSMGADGPEGKVGVGQVRATGAYAKSGDRSASMKSATLDGISADMSGGQAQVGLESAKVRDLRAQQGAKNRLNVGAVDVGKTQAAVGGLGPDGKPELLGAKTEGIDVHGLKANVSPGDLLKGKPKTGGQAGNANTSAGTGGGQEDKKEEFKADALRGMTGHVNAVLPVTDPISTKVTIDIPVVNGLVKLDDLEVDVTGLLAEIAIGDNPLEVTKDGGLLLDITGLWNVTLLEPGAAKGLVTKKQGGGDQGTIRLEDLVEGLMNAKVEKKGSGSAEPDKKKKKKKKKKDDKPPINLGKTEIHIAGLSAGDGRVGTSSGGITLDREGDAGANKISVDGKLGEDVKVRADRLRGKDLDAGGAHVEDVDVDGLKIDVDKPLEDQRSVSLNADRIGLGETTFGDQDALKKDKR